MRVKEESEKGGLKYNIKKTKIMASGPITSWQIGEEQKRRQILFPWAPKITENGDYSHEIKRYLLLGRKAMTDRYSILKSRDIILLTNIPIVKAIIFPIVMYRCESWTTEKAECQGTDAFDLWC